MKPIKPKLPQENRRQKDAPAIFLSIDPPKPRVKYANPPLRYYAGITLGTLILMLALESRARKRAVKLGTVGQ
jgi:hypothetical protein